MEVQKRIISRYTEYDQRGEMPYTARQKKSALLNRAGNQLSTVPYPV